MNIPKAYIKGFQKAGNSPRMILILYFANIITALILALPFFGFLKESFGDSVLFKETLQGFDFTSFSNLTFYNADGLSTILGSVKWIVLAYFLLNIFLTGGIINTLDKEKFTTANFFGGAAYNFFRFLGLNVLILVLHVGIAVGVYAGMQEFIQSLDTKMATELSYYYVVIGSVGVYLLLFLLISMIGDYAKFYLVVNNSFNIFKGCWKGIKYVFKHFAKTYFLYLFLLIIPAAVMYFYLHFEKDLKMATGLGILIAFGIQQAFVLLRVFLRVWVMASQYKMYADDFIQTEVVENKIFSVENSIDTKKEKKEEKKAVVKVKTEEETENTAYSIDFDQTFSSENKIKVEESVLTEAEMLKRMESEEEKVDQVVNSKPEPEFEVVKKEAEKVVEEPTKKVELLEELNNNDEILGDDDNDDDYDDEFEDDDEFENNYLREQVIQNVVDPEIEDEDEVVTTGKPEELKPAELNAEKEKKTSKIDDDMIEFEL